MNICEKITFTVFRVQFLSSTLPRYRSSAKRTPDIPAAIPSTIGTRPMPVATEDCLGYFIKLFFYYLFTVYTCRIFLYFAQDV